MTRRRHQQEKGARASRHCESFKATESTPTSVAFAVTGRAFRPSCSRRSTPSTDRGTSCSRGKCSSSPGRRRRGRCRSRRSSDTHRRMHTGRPRRGRSMARRLGSGSCASRSPRSRCSSSMSKGTRRSSCRYCPSCHCCCRLRAPCSRPGGRSRRCTGPRRSRNPTGSSYTPPSPSSTRSRGRRRCRRATSRSSCRCTSGPGSRRSRAARWRRTLCRWESRRRSGACRRGSRCSQSTRGGRSRTVSSCR
jgi:hypothetical protein